MEIFYRDGKGMGTLSFAVLLSSGDLCVASCHANVRRTRLTILDDVAHHARLRENRSFTRRALMLCSVSSSS